MPEQRTVTVTIELQDGRGPERFDRDIATVFDDYDAVVVPRDTAYGLDDQHASQPNWDLGAYLQDRTTGREVPGWSFGGRPPQFFIDCWNESNRRIIGAIAGRDLARHN